MLRKFLMSKIHRATVTHCDVDYVGSITIDADLLRVTGIRPSECVLVADCDNGNRFETYVFEGESGTGVIGVNGAAALLTAVGHKLIICAFAQLQSHEIDAHQPRIAIVDDQNRITQTLRYNRQISEQAGARD
ncbi:MAG: aspartate 1-decarboxylase [Phycisphaeraceae bacterium]